MRDWSDGHIDRAYSVGCYRTALRNLPEDLRVYSSAPEDIQAALQRRLTRSSAHPLSRGLAVAGKRRTGHAAASATQGLDRPATLAVALGAFGLALAALGVIGGLVRRRRRAR